MPGSILGTMVTRVEDPHLLRGQASYVDNLEHPGALFCRFVRSTAAHAEIVSVEVSSALELPGVHSVLTYSDLGIGSFVPFFALNQHLMRTALANKFVQYVGDPVALIIADSISTAEDAAELIEVTYRDLPPVIDKTTVFEPDTTQLNPNVTRNLAASIIAENSKDPLDDAEVVVRAKIQNQRMAVSPMEPNSIAVEFDQEHNLLIYVSTQMPHFFANRVRSIFSIPEDKLHVISPDVGGGFGGKAGVAAEHVAVIAAAIALDKPLRWVESREENLLSMQGRDQLQYVELGLTKQGKITGLRARMIGDAGAYGGFGGGLVIGSTKSMAQGVYEIPKISFRAAVASTNTPPVGALRGAGRPEATAFLERVIDMGAKTIGMDPIEFRRQNLIGKDKFPYQTLMGSQYDSGDYELALNRVAEIAHYEDLRIEQARRISANEHVLLGIGVSCYVEVTAGGGSSEFGSVEITEGGKAIIKVGTSGHGQGHATTFSMLVSDALGIPLEDIEFIQSDTKLVPRGGGTGGSRSLQLGGTAVKQAALEVLEIAKTIAADHFEANRDDVQLGADGGLEIAGSPSFSLSWVQLREMAQKNATPLVYNGDFNQSGATFPFGAHISVVEVDTETGKVTPISHFAVDDCGTVVNPLVVAGQQHGGIAQGIGQALYEEFLFDEFGNPKNISLGDYLVTSAAEMPNFVVENTQTPSPLNPLGAKGIGESATVGSTPAVQNAVIDALSHLGVLHIDMPMTPERVWNAIVAGKDAKIWSEPSDVFEDLYSIFQTKSDAAEVDI